MGYISKKTIKAIKDSLGQVTNLQYHYTYKEPNREKVVYYEGVESALEYVLEIVDTHKFKLED